jgi:hypothetical protein
MYLQFDPLDLQVHVVSLREGHQSHQVDPQPLLVVQVSQRSLVDRI